MDDKNSMHTPATLKYGEFPVDSGDEDDSKPVLQSLKAFVYDPEDDTEEVPTPSPPRPGLPPAPAREPPAPKSPEGTGPPKVVEAVPSMDRATTKSLESEKVESAFDAFAMLQTVCDADLLLNSKMILPTYLDDLVLGATKLPPWENEKSALSLHLCLGTQFNDGIEPDNMMQLSPHVVTWMQQLVNTPCATMWDAESQKAIEAYTSMRKSSEGFHERINATESTLSAVASAAMRSFDDTRKMYEGKPNQEQMLITKATTLCKWVTSRQSQAQESLEKAAARHEDVRAAFLAEVSRMVVAAHQQHVSEKEVPVVDENTLFEQLDKDLENELGMGSTEPEKVSLKETPEEVVPDTKRFEAILSTALAGVPVDDPTHKALVENLGKVYTRTLFGSQPVHPPAGDDQTSADDKAPTSIYII